MTLVDLSQDSSRRYNRMSSHPKPVDPDEPPCSCSGCSCSTLENCLAAFEHYNLYGGPFTHDACCSCVVAVDLDGVM
jgi:hypothetical protein